MPTDEITTTTTTTITTTTTTQTAPTTAPTTTTQTPTRQTTTTPTTNTTINNNIETINLVQNEQEKPDYFTGRENEVVSVVTIEPETVRYPDQTQKEVIEKRQEQERQQQESDRLKYEYLKSLDESEYKSTEQIRDPGVRNEAVVYGCMNTDACNYSPVANRSDMSCVYCGSQQICTKEKVCCDDPDNNGICGDQRISGCMNPTACNFNQHAQVDNGSCIAPIGCDSNRCPGSSSAPKTLDKCGVCGGDGQSCIQTEGGSVVIRKPVEEQKPVPTIPTEKPIEENKPVEQSKPISTEKPDNQQNPVAIENPVVTEKPVVTNNTGKPFSFTVSKQQVDLFRRCLSSQTDHLGCLQSIGSKQGSCLSTVKGAIFGKRISIMSIENHQCEQNDQNKQPENNDLDNEQINNPNPTQKETIATIKTIHLDNKSITENTESINTYIPIDAPKTTEIKHNELYISAETIDGLREIIVVITELGVNITTITQPFIETGIENIYKLGVSMEGSMNISTLLEAIDEYQQTTDKTIDANSYSVPIFRVAAAESTASSHNYPYYFEQLGRQQFINECAPNITQKRNIKIAIIDNAFDITHEDLQQNVVYSYDVADNNTNTMPPSSTNPARNHGTIAAGIIGATAENDIGIIGVSNDIVDLYLLKATSDSANAEDITAGIEAIAKAIELKVDIINLSRGAYIDHPIVRRIIKQANDAGIIVVAAAGNYGSDKPFFPAAYSSVIGVGALDQSNNQATFSNYGERVNTVMYGESIEATNIDNKYGLFDGTSKATPLFAGTIGLTMSYGVPFRDIFVDNKAGKPFISLKDLCDSLSTVDQSPDSGNPLQENDVDNGIGLDGLQGSILDSDSSSVNSSIFQAHIQNISSKAVSIRELIRTFIKNTIAKL